MAVFFSIPCRSVNFSKHSRKGGGSDYFVLSYVQGGHLKAYRCVENHENLAYVLYELQCTLMIFGFFKGLISRIKFFPNFLYFTFTNLNPKMKKKIYFENKNTRKKFRELFQKSQNLRLAKI